MPDATPARLQLSQALDEGLAVLFRRLQSEPAPAALVGLADQLEAEWLRGSQIAAERRAIG
jgi:hypothetical protein